MRQLKKVTKLFVLISLCLMIVALGFAAKHGQYESPGQHGHFLSKSVKMERLSGDLDAAMNCSDPPTAGVLHVEVLFTVQPPPASEPLIAPLGNFSLPLLV